MSGITLSASVRQNLLSLQSTADLLSTTQSRLSTGNKVNSALDNPTNFFTAQGLNNRSSDINNLLDGIGNGVQILQAANTGITSLQKLVDSAKSIANQALQTTTGYSTKSNVSTTIAGATADDLRGTSTFSSASAIGNVVSDGTAGGASPITATTTLGGVAGSLVAPAATKAGDGTAAFASTLLLTGTGAATDLTAAAAPKDGDVLVVNGKTITFKAGAAPAAAAVPTGSGVSGNIVTDGSGNSSIYLSGGTVADVLTAVDLASGVAKTVNTAGAATITGNTSAVVGGITTLNTSTGSDLTVTGKADLLKEFGLTSSIGAGNVSVTAARTTAATTTANLIKDGSTLNVNGHTITFSNAAQPAAAQVPAGSGIQAGSHLQTDGSGNSIVYLSGATVADTLKAIDLATGVQTASNAAGVSTLTVGTGLTASSVSSSGTLKLSTGTAADLSISGTGNALSALGLNGPTGSSSTFTAARAAGTGGVNGKTLSFSSFNGGTAVDVTLGDGTNGTVKSLAQLNVKLAANNLGATVDANGVLTIAASNDYASTTIGSAVSGGTIGGTLTSALSFTTAQAPVQDAAAQTTRANLVSQFNNVLEQINTTSKDSSFNGVNLLGGDTLKLTFNETGKSTLNIQGVNFNSAGLGLSSLTSGTDFIDNASTNKVLSTLTTAASTLRSQASALGSNLSIVQLRQDFSKNLINVLQTGASNLTLADTNEEAANSQALSTRQSIAVSALSLANQSQQGVLQLLR
ncbi:flagellin [Nitrobacteraceae bacterium AZCC 2146]